MVVGWPGSACTPGLACRGGQHADFTTYERMQLFDRRAHTRRHHSCPVSYVQLSEGGFQVVYPLGLWSRFSGVVKVRFGYGL